MSSGTVDPGDWLATMVGAAHPLDGVSFGAAIVAVTSGDIAWCNPAMDALLEHDAAETPGSLLELVLATDRDDLLAFLRSRGRRDAALVVRARSSGGAEPSPLLTIHATRVHAVRGDGEVVLLTATDEAGTADPPPTDTTPWLVRVLCDVDGLVVAVDEPWSGIALDDPAVGTASLVGSHPFVMTHPADVPLVAPIFRALATGEVLDAEYVVRGLDPTGRWANVRVQACRLDGPSPLVLLAATPHDRHVRTIAPTFLTGGELEVARALFAGRRPQEIAALRQASIRTVRNQINAAYRKLDVANVGELTSRYSLPLRPAPPRPRVARSPKHRQ